MNDDYENIPGQMRSAKRWILWKSIPNKDPKKKNRKVPYYANGQFRSGELDSELDNSNLATFETANNALLDGDYTGLGFALGPDGTGNYWQGVDFDEISKRPLLQMMIDDMPGYTEMSPSGDGWHSIGYGRKFESMGSNESGIEAYSHGRYFTVTGEGSGLSDPCCIAEYAEALRPIHNKFIPKKDVINNESAEYEKITPKTMQSLRGALFFMRADDRELWQKNGHRLKGLGDAGRGLWLEWSATSDKFDPANDAKTWDSFRPTHTGYRAIFTEAQKMGWVNPEKKISEPVEDIDTSLEPKWLNGDDLADNATPPEFLINDILETNSHGLLSGSSQAFKTFLVIAMAHSVCTGNDFFGNPVFTMGKVLYICGEGHGALSRRIKALKIVEGGFNENLKILDQPIGIDDARCMDWLRESINKIKPMLLIADTFSSLAFSTNENDNSEVARTLRLISGACENEKTSSIVIHHYGKDATRGSRGAYAFTGNVDFEFNMERVTDSMSTVLSCKKMKDGDLFLDINLMAHVVDLGLTRQDGKQSSSLILKRSLEASDLPKNQQKALDAIKTEIIANGADLPDGRAVLFEKDIKLCLSAAFVDSANRYKAFNDHLPPLISKGLVKFDGEFYSV